MLGLLNTNRGKIIIDDVELDDDEQDEDGVLNPRTEDLDDDEMGIN